MKKLAIALFLLPAFSFAESVDFVGVKYENGAGDAAGIDGYSIGVKSVMDEKSMLEFSYRNLSSEIDSAYAFSTSLKFALHSFATGSAYIGGAYTWAEYDSELNPTVGYAKVTGEGLDYDVSVTFVDEGEDAITATLRGPVGDSGLGWSAGVGSDGDVTVTTLGLNVVF